MELCREETKPQSICYLQRIAIDAIKLFNNENADKHTRKLKKNKTKQPADTWANEQKKTMCEKRKEKCVEKPNEFKKMCPTRKMENSC